MNKKIIALIVAVVILAILGVVAYMITNNQELANTNETRNNAEQNSTNLENAGDENNMNQNAVSNSNKVTNEEPQTEETGRTLVVYFSHTGNTENVANFIHKAVGGDIIKLEPVNAYTDDYNTLLDVAQEEQRNDARPEIATKIDNIDEYDTIFLGYPNWWGDMPMIIYSFLDEYDLSGKTIAPFCTSGGSGLSGTPRTIQNEEPNATVTEGLAVSGSSSRNSQSTVNNWLSQIQGDEEILENARIKLTVNGNEEVFVSLDDNQASRDFLEMLPLTLTFEDYNSTEKIATLPNELSTEGQPSGYTPEIGDFAYYAPWGNISVFYKDFRYSNSLYKLGTIESGTEIFTNMNNDFEVTIERVN